MQVTTSTVGPETSESTRLPVHTIRDLWDVRCIIALTWTLAQIYFVLAPGIDTFSQRALHVGFALALGISMLSTKTSPRSHQLGVHGDGAISVSALPLTLPLTQIF